MIQLPKIGDVITSTDAIELCKHYNLNYLVGRIEENLTLYKPWRFDGVSGLPDNITSFFIGCDPEKLTYLCALPHDLAYAYGKFDDFEEKSIVDEKFKQDLMDHCEFSLILAEMFYVAVRVFGTKYVYLPFTWGFAIDIF